MRRPDEPGTYRIKRKTDGTWWVGGLTSGGQRVRQNVGSQAEAESIASVLFPKQAPLPKVEATFKESIDDWGIPLSVNPDVAGAVNSTLGVPPPIPPGPPPPVVEAPPPVDEKKRKEDQERAKSLCEFLGVCWAAGDVWVAKRLTVAIGKEPVNPSINQVNNLSKAAKTAFVDLLGDLEVGPWTMLMLLSIALPASMMIQARPLPARPKDGTKSAEPSSQADPHLKSV